MSDNENQAPDPLDALLRESDNYVADDGFTARVVTALPARRRNSWLRPVIFCLASLIGIAIAIACIPNPAETVRTAFEGAHRLHFKTLLPLLPLLAALAPILWGAFEMAREEN